MTTTPAAARTTTAGAPDLALDPAVRGHPSRVQAVTIAEERGGRARVTPAVLVVVPAVGVAVFGLARSVSAGVTTADAIRLELTLG